MTKEYHVSDIATPTASYLTQEAFDRLKAELAQLSGEGRAEIAKKIEAAREEGDLRENGGYHAAKEEQGKIEARIRQLTQLLHNAKVGAQPADDGVVEPGMVVTVDLLGDDLTFLLGSREIAEEALQESQRLLATLLSNLPGMAYRCDNNREWTMRFVSDGCLELTGYTPFQLVENRDIDFISIIHPDDREGIWNATMSAVQSTQPFTLTYRADHG